MLHATCPSAHLPTYLPATCHLPRPQPQLHVLLPGITVTFPLQLPLLRALYNYFAWRASS